MNNLLALVAFVLAFAPSISYFQYQRPVQAGAAGQNYVVVDEPTWAHARGDLGDLRLYLDGKEFPYALIEERGDFDPQRRGVPVLQQSTVEGKTQFLVDMASLEEYDRVELTLATKNFVAHAYVEGQDDPHGKTWAKVGDGIIYDLSAERLGSNYVLRFPLSKFRYLRVTIDGPVKPKEVQGALTESGKQKPPSWREVAGEGSTEQRGRDTIVTFNVSEKVPVERISIAVDPQQINYRREVEVRDEKDYVLGNGELSRIHMVRSGQKIDSENQAINVSTRGHKQIKIVIHNGDDAPLKIQQTRLQQIQRRVYFDAPSAAQFTLYYGDDKLSQPVYDYAKLFAQSASPAQAQLGGEATNSQYAGRPDDRPWTERHPAVVWTAIVAAVLILGTMALKSMKS